MSIDQQLVSRSAFKLMEAIDLFSIHIDPQAHALDLGAAPGGWSQVLASYGAHVTAVDPGELDPRVACLPNVRVFSGTAQAFMRTGSEQFDLIVDDMRLDARESARLLVAAQALLRPSAVALITLKLPERAPSAVLAPALATLRSDYSILGARCLYFNRNEVTVYVRSHG
jgi:23S rRNA (cytidine2498-2'-O)-methyltransferase